MKKLILLISSTLTMLPLSLMAAEAPDCDKKDYSCYTAWVAQVCKSPDQKWNKSSLGAVTKEYARIESDDIKKKIDEIIATEKNPNEKVRLEKELDLNRIGLFEGFKTVEIARIQYRTNMNRIFSCAVIGSRIGKLQEVSDIIKKNGSTEISEKLEKDAAKLKMLKPESCGSTEIKDYSYALASSATTEFCNYRHYLDYLGENISNDYSNIMNIEKKIGTSSPGQADPSTLGTVANAITSRITQIENDLIRAHSTLPKALVAYREMERTYTTHLMLLFIYDDYLELRQNMNIYLNAFTQLFAKAKNAQSANNK